MTLQQHSGGQTKGSKTDLQVVLSGVDAELRDQMVLALGLVRNTILTSKPDMDDKQVERRLDMVAQLHGEIVLSFSAPREVFAEPLYGIMKSCKLSANPDHSDYNMQFLEAVLSAAGSREPGVSVGEGFRRFTKAILVEKKEEIEPNVENIEAIVEALEDYVRQLEK